MPLRHGEYCKTWNIQEYVHMNLWCERPSCAHTKVFRFCEFVNHIPVHGPTLHKNFGRQRVEGLRWSTFFRAIFRMTKIRTLNYPTSITWRGSYHLTNSNGGGLKNKGSSNKVLLLLLWSLQNLKKTTLSAFLRQNLKIIPNQICQKIRIEFVKNTPVLMWMSHIWSI